MEGEVEDIWKVEDNLRKKDAGDKTGNERKWIREKMDIRNRQQS